MQLTSTIVTTIIVLYVAFGLVGLRLSRRFKRPVSKATWTSLLGLSFVANYLLIGLSGYVGMTSGPNLCISAVIQGIGLGMIIGLVTREMRMKAEKTAVE